MASVYEDHPSEVAVRNALRILNAVVAVCGLILNTIILAIEQVGYHGHAISDLTGAAYIPLILSIALGYLDTCSSRSIAKPSQYLIMVVEAGISLGFLALVIAGCFVISDSEDHIRLGKVILLMFNVMPWVVCSVMHLLFTFDRLKDIIGLESIWSSHPMSGDGAKYSMLGGQMEADDDLEDNRGEDSCRRVGPIHLTDDA